MRSVTAIFCGVVIGILIGATVSSASGRGSFENLTQFLSASRTFQQGYTAGVWDTLAYIENNADSPLTPDQISGTLNCMDHPTLGPTADWVERRVRAETAKGTNSVIDSIMVFGVHPCSP